MPATPRCARAVAAQVAREQGVQIGGEHVVMSCGASGAMNAVLKTILDPGDEVIASIPCFMEYVSYVDNHGGKLVIVTVASRFQPRRRGHREP